MGNFPSVALPNLNLKARFKSGCRSECCNENNSYSYQICSMCGSKVNLHNLKFSEFDIAHLNENSNITGDKESKRKRN